jgi:hypothetical protein
MERRHFLKIAFGFVAGAGLVAQTVTRAQAAPLLPTNPLDNHRPDSEPQPAVASQDDVDRLRPEQVRWHRGWRGRHWGWRHRHWGWRRRHWGVRRRYWRRRYWRRRYW